MSRMYGGILRASAGSGAMPGGIHLLEFSTSALTCTTRESRPLHFLFSVPISRAQQLKLTGATRGIQCGLASKLMTYRKFNRMILPHHQFWLEKKETRSGYLARSMIRKLSLADVDANSSQEAWNQVRSMSSSKTKGQPRGSLWRTRSVISKETVQAVHDLKRNKQNPQDLYKVFQMRIPRLLKMDLLATLSELQRQGEMELALQVFDIVRKEIWYKPDIFVYRSMLDALGKNRMISEIEKKFQELQDEGLKPDVYIYRELVGAYVRAHMLPQALEAHAKMEEIGCGDDHLTLYFLQLGREKEAVRLKQRKKAAEELERAEQNLEVDVSAAEEENLGGNVGEPEERKSAGTVSDGF